MIWQNMNENGMNCITFVLYHNSLIYHYSQISKELLKAHCFVLFFPPPPIRTAKGKIRSYPFTKFE